MPIAPKKASGDEGKLVKSEDVGAGARQFDTFRSLARDKDGLRRNDALLLMRLVSMVGNRKRGAAPSDVSALSFKKHCIPIQENTLDGG